MYLAFRETNNAKCRAVRHLVEPEPDAAYGRRNADLEEARVDKVSHALDGKNVLDHSVEHEPPCREDCRAISSLRDGGDR